MIRIVKTQFLVGAVFRRYLPPMTNSIDRIGGGAGGGFVGGGAGGGFVGGGAGGGFLGGGGAGG
jgi:hypothetical protein